MGTETSRWDAAEHLDSREAVLAYLEAAFEDGDPELITAAFDDVARAKDITGAPLLSSTEVGEIRQMLEQAQDVSGAMSVSDETSSAEGTVVRRAAPARATLPPRRRSGMAYRRRKGSDTWHWCRNCNTWPTHDYDERATKPSSGDLCNTCKARDAAGSCTR